MIDSDSKPKPRKSNENPSARSTAPRPTPPQRRKLYRAYAWVIALALILLRMLPPAATRMVLPIVIFSIPSVVGLLFAAGLAIVDQSQSDYSTRLHTPLRRVRHLATRLALHTISGSIAAALFVSVSGVARGVTVVIMIVAPTALGFAGVGIALAACLAKLQNTRPTTASAPTTAALAFTLIPFAIPLLAYFELVSRASVVSRVAVWFPGGGPLALLSMVLAGPVFPAGFGEAWISTLLYALAGTGLAIGLTIRLQPSRPKDHPASEAHRS